jgi:hypothetical protein
MACYNGLGNLTAGDRSVRVGDFDGDGLDELLMYYPADGNLWLFKLNTATLTWKQVGNTLGQGPTASNLGNITDGRPLWVGDFDGDGREDLLFYYPGDGNWWLGSMTFTSQAPNDWFQWKLVSNTAGFGPGPNFGDVGDGRPFWVGDFTGDGATDVLFHYPGDGNWWLATLGASPTFVWSPGPVSNTLGQGAGQPNFGDVADGRPFWVGDFDGKPGLEILFYYPGDGNWWLGSFTGGAAPTLTWSLAGNTMGATPADKNFGQVWDGRPFWIGAFEGAGAQVMFHYPDDGNWWLGTFDVSASPPTLGWNLAGNTKGQMQSQPNFGDLGDGRPFRQGRFVPGIKRENLLMYSPADGNWWIGIMKSGLLQWNPAGNTLGQGPGAPNFGAVDDGRPWWVGRFASKVTDSLVFYFPGDGNVWRCTWNKSATPTWLLLGNPGQPFAAKVGLHVKLLTNPTPSVAARVTAMVALYGSVGIWVDLKSVQNLNLPGLADIDVGECITEVGPIGPIPTGLYGTTDEQDELFAYRDFAENDDVVVYVCKTVLGSGGFLNGCAVYPNGQPGAVISARSTIWTMPHEVGHVLGLDHVGNTNRLMFGGGTANITNPPPDLTSDEADTMIGNAHQCDD